MMRRFLTTTLLAILFSAAFQACEEDSTSSGIGPLYEIKVTPYGANIEIGSTKQFTAAGSDVNKNVIPDLTFSWTSNNTDIATVDSDGLVKGVGVGSTTITASLEEVESSPATVNIHAVILSVQIGDQVWMAENLRVTYYRNAKPIPTGHSISEWLNLTTAAYTAYDNDENNAATYGYLYNWYAVNDNRNIAPQGWHVPTDDEWKQLEMYLGMSQSEVDREGLDRGTDEGGKLKEAGTAHWHSPNTGATNESGFTALPGGFREDEGTYSNTGYSGYFWSSTESSSDHAWGRMLSYISSDVSRHGNTENRGLSVRCIKD